MENMVHKVDPFWENASRLSDEEIDKQCPPKTAEAIKAYKKARENDGKE